MVKRINNKFESFYNSFFKNIQNIRNLLFYLGLFCTLIIFTASSSKIIKLDNLLTMNLQILIEILLILKIILTKEKLSNYLFFSTIIILAIICDRNMGVNFDLFPVILLILASRQIDHKKIIKLILWFNIVVISYHYIVYILDYVFDCGFFNFSYQNTFMRDGLLRHSFYFYHPNTFSNYVFWTYLMYFYLNFDNKDKLPLIVFIGVLLAIITYIFPNSRNACLFYFIVFGFYALLNCKKLMSSKKVQFLLTFTFVICLCISFLLLFFVNTNGFLGNFADKVNMILNNRLMVGSRYLSVCGVSLFGNLFTVQKNLLAIGYTRVILDNWYYYLVIRVGIFASLFYLYSFTKALTKSVENNDYSKVFVIVIFLLYNCIESIGINPQISFPFFIIGMFL